MIQNIKYFNIKLMQYHQNVKSIYDKCKFGVKVGIAAGACYYLAEEGVWKDSNESIKLYGKISEAVAPLVKEVPIEIPDLPNTQCMSYLAKQTWNSGVMKTFEFLNNLPTHASEWTSKGMSAVTENPEMKKFVDSFSAPQSPPTPVVEAPKK